MKKNFVFMAIIAMLLAALVVPATAAAAGPKTGEDFTAVGMVAVTGFQMHRTVETGNGIVDIAVHETVSGYVLPGVPEYDQSGNIVNYTEPYTDWADIIGAEFASSSTGVAKLNPVDMSLEGSITGSFTMVAADGISTLNGHMWIEVDAPLLTDEDGLVLDENGYPIITGISDTGTFKISNGTGALKGIKASGTLSATLYPTTVQDPTTGEWVDTYAGLIILDGQYR